MAYRTPLTLDQFLSFQVGEEDSLWRLELVRGEAGLEATLHRRDYLDTELEVVRMTMVAMRIRKRSFKKNSFFWALAKVAISVNLNTKVLPV